MTRVDDLDKTQRRINSMLFRVTLIVYSILLLAIHEDYFTAWTYGTAITIYLLVYLRCLRYDILRLINDFGVIMIILWGKDPFNIYCFTFLILPCVNAINFSGQKRTSLLYALTYLSFQILYYVHYSKFDYNINILLPILSYYVINLYTSERLKVKRFRDELITTVENFYLDKELVKKPYKLYKKFILLINSHTQRSLVQNLYCFAIDKGANDKIIIVNSTHFIWNFKFLDKNFIANLRKGKPLLNQSILLESSTSNLNLVIYTTIDDNEYFYVFTLNREVPFYYDIIGFYGTLEPALVKISKTLLAEKILRQLRNEEILKLSEKALYVNRANNMMHFIRNRLSAFKNLVKMIDTIEHINSTKIEAFKNLLHDQNSRASIELRTITERADDMLEKSKNPFFYSILSDVSVKTVFILLRNSFHYYFPDNEIETDISLTSKKRYVQINEEGFEVFTSDWLNNIKKYRRNSLRCTFIEENNFLHITFINDYIIPREEIDKVVQDLMSSDRNEIMKRTTYGLYTIKFTLESMNIPFDVTHNGGLLEFKIKLKIFEHEDSDF